MICDEEYSKNIVIYFLIKIYNKFKEFLKENEIDLNIIEKDSDFKFEYILNEIEEWQDSSKINDIMVLLNELKDSQGNMVTNIKQLIKIDENLETLALKPTDSYPTSTSFYEQAKKDNRCYNF